MFIKSMARVLNSSCSAFNYNNFDTIDPNLIRYFRTEFGKDWKIALEQYLHKEKINNKKAA